LNPKDGSFGSIAFDSLTRLLKRKPWKELLPADLKLPAASKGAASKAIIVLGQAFIAEVCKRYAINEKRTRHKRSVRKMVGFAVNQCGLGLALKAAAELYKNGQLSGETSLDKHLAEVARAMRDFTKKEVAKLNRAERRAYLALKTEVHRRAFLILRNWWRKSKLEGEPDFYAHCATLASRLELSLEGASQIRKRFCKLGIMRETAPYVRHKWSARYEWLLKEGV
jgi:hypothetical protein